MSPLFKYPGGKRRLAPFIDSFRPAGWSVAEPFVGAGAYSLYAVDHGALQAWISDADPRVMLIHQALVNPDFPAAWRARAPDPKTKEEYLTLRTRVNRLLGQQVSIFVPSELGVLLIQLSRSAYCGLWRTNRRGDFNVPPGELPASMPSDAEVARVRGMYVIDVIPLSPRGFEDFPISKIDNVFVYCDPPYLGAAFTSYGNGRKFTLEDHARLARWAEAQVRARPGAVRVAISNQCGINTRRELYPRSLGWTIHEVRTRRSIGGGTGGAPHAEEFLAVLGGPT